MTRVEPNRLDLSENDRWAEPIAANFRNVLATSVGAQLPNAQIIAFPWYSTARPDYTVEVNVSRFERDPAGAAQLVAHWTVHEGTSNKLLATRDSSFNEAAQSGALTISDSAVIFRAQGTQVALVGHDNKVQLRSVKLGRDFGNTIEVLNGLDVKDRVIDNPPDAIADGMAVQIAEPAQTNSAK